MSSSPLVSVIIPAYNAAAFIGQTLDSVLSQTYRNLEVIVVDDGSQDQTAEIVTSIAQQDERIVLLHQKNQGVAAARNLAIQKSRGEYIAPVDADDIWYPQKIEKQVQRMLAGGPSVGLVYTSSLRIDEAASTVQRPDPIWNIEGAIYKTLIFVNFTGNASVPLIRRSCLEHVGGYNSQLRAQSAQGCEDWDLALRVAEHYQVRVAPEFLVGYRSVANSMSRNCAAMGKSYRLVMRDIKCRHPEIEDRIFRWSRGNFYLYLSGISYGAANHRQALHWAFQALGSDPAILLNFWVVKTIIQSVLWIVANPFSSLIWPDRKAWIDFKKRVGGRLIPRKTKEPPTIFGLEEKSSNQPLPWSPWKPYDWICIRRFHYTMRR